jgi:hypothetical protein
MRTPTLRLNGGGKDKDVATRKVLDEYTHDINSRHEGKSGSVRVEVKNPNIRPALRASDNFCISASGGFIARKNS